MLIRIAPASLLLAALACVGTTPAVAADVASSASSASVTFAAPIVFDGVTYPSWSDYVRSDVFREQGRRCAAPDVFAEETDVLLGAPSDCSLFNTNPAPEYDPTSPIMLTCVVHVIRSNSGSGDVPDALIHSQIDILNEDYQALVGSYGENGDDAMIQFELATVDPDGAPTTGITRTDNTTWYNDSGTYYDTLAWDPTRYINIYTNTAGGYLGYVPFLPQDGGVGSNADRIVCLWSAFGRDAPIGPPYDQGRTLTHEMGHYLGLFHTFQSGCTTASEPGCYTTGDRICDTNPEADPNFGCPSSRSTCSSPDPFDNYMDYSDDVCMERFTLEQINRIRCTIENYRGDLFSPSVGVTAGAPRASGFQLHQNRPNPFELATEIRFDLDRAQPVDLQVLDVTGRRVRTLFAGKYAAGPHRVTWNGTDDAGRRMAAGVYFVRLSTGDSSEIRRMVRMN